MGIPTNEQTLEPFFDGQSGKANVELQFANAWINALTAAQQVKAGPGLLHRITWGKGAAGTITLEDQNGASGGQVIQVLTITATTPPGTVEYNTKFANGLRVTQSVDLATTVVWR